MDHLPTNAAEKRKGGGLRQNLEVTSFLGDTIGIPKTSMVKVIEFLEYLKCHQFFFLDCGKSDLLFPVGDWYPFFQNPKSVPCQ